MMKRTLTLAGLSLMFMTTIAFAQRPMDDANERHVRIVQGPTITNISDDSVTISWTTSSSGANHVRYRVAGSNDRWQDAYHQGGGTYHSLELTGLERDRTYEWQILTRDGDLRTTGQFQTARRGYRDGDDRDRHDRDRDRDGWRDRDGRDYDNRVPLYRAVDRRGAHLYSTNPNDQNERNFRPEGTAGYILDRQRRGTVPLYRMVHRNGDYVLTGDPNGMRQYGYRDDGMVGYILAAQVPGTVPLYRLVKRDGSGHFFTASAEEREQTLRRGWKDEGITGYIWPR
jgi:hypothetical protein